MRVWYFPLHLLLIVFFAVPWSHAAELKEHTARAFELYVYAAEVRIQRQVAGAEQHPQGIPVQQPPSHPYRVEEKARPAMRRFWRRQEIDRCLCSDLLAGFGHVR